MGRLLMLIVVAGCTCALVLWLIAPRLLTNNSAAPTTNTSAQGTGNREQGTATTASSPQPGRPPAGKDTTLSSPVPSTSNLPNLAPMQTSEQKVISDYEAQRAPFYDILHRQCGDIVVEGRPALEDRSILVLYATRRDATIVTELLTRVVNPYAYAYGFRHVRFYLPNPRGSVEHYQLAAEANSDGNGHWQAFQHGS